MNGIRYEVEVGHSGGLNPAAIVVVQKQTLPYRANAVAWYKPTPKGMRKAKALADRLNAAQQQVFEAST